MSKHSSISEIFKGQVILGEQVTVKGWLRSKRDSKAGISFLAVHDGSTFDAIQAVVPDTLENYQAQVLSLSTGEKVAGMSSWDWMVAKRKLQMMHVLGLPISGRLYGA